MSRQPRPFGLWASPIQPESLAHSRDLKDVAWAADGRTVVWLERRGEGGVLVCQPPGQAPRDLTTTLSVRAQVGYGGGDFGVGRNQVFFVEEGGRIYRQSLQEGPAAPLTPAFGRAASPTVSRDGKWLVYVHAEDGIDRLAVVDTDGAFWPQRLVEGADFYMQPAWHPRGRALAWIEWDHPQMPWDGTRLVLGQLGMSRQHLPRVTETRVLAGDAATAIFQPAFSPDGRSLAYVSDRRGWSNLWLCELATDSHSCLTADEIDVGLPAWVQGQRVFGFSGDGLRLYFTRSEGGYRRAWCFDRETGATTPVEELAEYTCVETIAVAPGGESLACIASASRIPPRVLRCRPGRGRERRGSRESTQVGERVDEGELVSRRAAGGSRVWVLARSTDESIPPDALAQARAVSWLGDGGSRIHGLYYPPTGPRHHAEGRAPGVLMVHGGPTGQSDAGYSSRNQFFATRGYAVLDVNYRGSTGYGREYMEALRGNWGVSDIEDAASGARYLIEEDLADPGRLVIMGSSAGGYTVLRALTEYPGLFKAGVCLYGISNLFALATDSHKFEAHYLDTLVGPLPAARDLYRERSPLFACDRLRDPVAIFQGTDDRVVPPDQAESIVASLRRRHVPHEYHVYEGEGHGWRKPETVAAFYRAVEAFMKQYVLFA